MTSSVASRPGFLRWLVTAGDPATLVATFSTAAGSPVNLSGSTVAAACANWSTSHAGSATVGGASNNEVTVAFTDTITGQLTGGGWTWTLTVDGVTTLAGPLDVAQPGVAGVTGGDASAVVVVDDVNVAVTVTTAGGGGVSLGETSTTAYRGDRGKTAYDHTLVTSGNPHGTTAADVGAATQSDIDSSIAAARGADNGLAPLDGDGTVPDIRLPASIARDSEVTSAVSAHAAATDPHGDRAYSVQRANHTGTQAQSTVTDLVTDLAAMVPKSLIDAKGDLIVGTANDTAARLAVGSDGQVLTADSGEASGVKWAAAPSDSAAPMVPYAGMYQVAFIGATGSTDAGFGAVNRESYIPMFIPGATYDRIGLQVLTTGTLHVELGLYSINSSHHPASLIVSFGTLDLSVGTGLQLLSISQTIAAGWYYIGTKVTAFTSAPVMWRATATTLPAIPGWPVRSSTPNESYSMLLKSTGLSGGGLPSTAPTIGGGSGQAAFAQEAPRIFLRHA